ncbi:MAG: hypothetical protein UDG94_00175 [Peptococcaceae bacterium]|nr:hypothetical protein [Peptococcaceae bacterium]
MGKRRVLTGVRFTATGQLIGGVLLPACRSGDVTHGTRCRLPMIILRTHCKACHHALLKSM